MNLKSANLTTLLRKGDVDSIKTMSELIQKLHDRTFYLEDNYIVPDKLGLVDLYNKFVKYIINYHFRKLYQLTSRGFLANQPVFNNQKDVFLRRVENLGFGDIFRKYDLKLDI
jgi:DNA topoisomerase IA